MGAARVLRDWGVTSNRQALMFMLYAAAFHIGLMGMVDVLLNFYFVSLGHNPDTIGYLQSLPRLSGFLTSIPMGLLTNRIGARRMVIYATVGFSLSFALMIAFPTLEGLTLSRFLNGFFYGAQQIALSPLMIVLMPSEQHTRFFAAHNVVAMIATSAGSVIGGLTPTLIVALGGAAAGISDPHSTWAYGLALLVASATGVLSITPLWWLTATSDTARTDPKTLGATFNLRGWKWRKLILITFPLLPFGFTGGLTFPFYNLFFRERFHLPDPAVGTILSIGWLGMAFIPLLNPFWELRFGRATALGITLSIAALAFAGLGLAEILVLSVICFTLGAAFRNSMQPLFQPLIMSHLAPAEHNLASSIGMVLWNIGWFTSTNLNGWLHRTIGFQGIMLVVSGGLIITAISVRTLSHSNKQKD